MGRQPWAPPAKLLLLGCQLCSQLSISISPSPRSSSSSRPVLLLPHPVSHTAVVAAACCRAATASSVTGGCSRGGGRRPACLRRLPTLTGKSETNQPTTNHQPPTVCCYLTVQQNRPTGLFFLDKFVFPRFDGFMHALVSDEYRPKPRT